MLLDTSTLMGLVWMLVLGPAVGNYACSVVYRLPLGRTPFERHPFCGSCNADLKPIDLFPILSYCLTGGKCRYCAAKIPGIYTIIELACLLIFVANFLVFGISEAFLLYTAGGVFVVILAAIQLQQGWLAATIYSYAWACVLLARTVDERSIYPAVQGFVVAMVLALAAHFLWSKIKRTTPRIDTPFVWWAALTGLVVPMCHWELFLVPLSVIGLTWCCQEKRAASAIIAWSAGILLLIPLSQI
jgi:prepilin signal peptidase PulO-like enzyme (type II secretory pathway)